MRDARDAIVECRRKLLAAIKQNSIAAFSFDRFLQSENVSESVARRAADQIFFQLCRKAVADGKISDKERSTLQAASRSLKISVERTGEIEQRANAKRVDEEYDRALEDGVISDAEQSAIDALRETLGLPQHSDDDFLAALSDAATHSVEAEEIHSPDSICLEGPKEKTSEPVKFLTAVVLAPLLLVMWYLLTVAAWNYFGIFVGLWIANLGICAAGYAIFHFSSPMCTACRRARLERRVTRDRERIHYLHVWDECPHCGYSVYHGEKADFFTTESSDGGGGGGDGGG